MQQTLQNFNLKVILQQCCETKMAFHGALKAQASTIGEGELNLGCGNA